MKIRIFGKRYTAEFVSASVLPNDAGDCNDEKQLIRVRKDHHPDHQADTLLHEVTHAIDFAADTKLTEHQVRTLATGLLGVMLDNPHLVEFLCTPHKETRESDLLDSKSESKTAKPRQARSSTKPKQTAKKL